MSTAPETQMRRARIPRQRVPWGESILRSMWSLGKTGLFFTVVAGLAAGFLLIPPALYQSNVFGEAPQALGIVIRVAPESISTGLRAQIDSEFTVYGDLVETSAAGEQIWATFMPPEGVEGSIVGATVFFGGSMARQWSCGMTYVLPNSDGIHTGMVDPKGQKTEVSSTELASSLEPNKNASWSAQLDLIPDPHLIAGDAELVGVNCMRALDSIGSNDAGNRWFTVTDVVLAGTAQSGDTSELWPEEAQVIYRQFPKITTPQEWTEVSGLKTRDGTDPSASLMEDQIAAKGFMNVTLPVRLDPPGTTLTYVYRDNSVAQAIGTRNVAGWTVVAAWLGYVLSVVLSRVSKLRNEDHKSLI